MCIHIDVCVCASGGWGMLLWTTLHSTTIKQVNNWTVFMRFKIIQKNSGLNRIRTRPFTVVWSCGNHAPNSAPNRTPNHAPFSSLHRKHVYTLRLLRVNKKDSGNYICRGHNVIGKSQSKKIRIMVKKGRRQTLYSVSCIGPIL